MENEALPEGTDGTELFTSSDIKDVYIEHNGKMWHFKFAALSWKDSMELASEMQEQQTNVRVGITTTVPKYWRYLTKVYLKCVKECPSGFLFDKCSMEFGEKLIKAMPGIGQISSPEDISEDEVKN